MSCEAQGAGLPPDRPHAPDPEARARDPRGRLALLGVQGRDPDPPTGPGGRDDWRGRGAPMRGPAGRGDDRDSPAATPRIPGLALSRAEGRAARPLANRWRGRTADRVGAATARDRGVL